MLLLLFGYDGSEEQQPEPVTVHSVHSNLCTQSCFGFVTQNQRENISR